MNLDLFCIDNARVIYRKIQYLHRYDQKIYLCSYANIILITHIHLLLFNFQQNWKIPVNLMKIYLAIVKLFNKNLHLVGCDAVSQCEWFLMFHKDDTPSKCWEITDPMT